MKLLKALLPVFCCLILFPAVANAQSGGAELSLKARVSGFQGRFGDTYAALGLEPALTIRPNGTPLAFGASFSQSSLLYNATSDMKATQNLIGLHAGVKGTVKEWFHPYAYALVGLRLFNYKNENTPADIDPEFSSLSLGLGARAGFQVGKGLWRFDGNIEYLTGTNSRYLTPDSFRQAEEQGKNVRDFANRSLITSVTVSAGVALVIDWDKITQD